MTADQRSISCEYCTATPATRDASATALSTSGQNRSSTSSPKSRSWVGREPPRTSAAPPPVSTSLARHGSFRASARRNRERSARRSAATESLGHRPVLEMLPGPAQLRLERAAIAQLCRDPFRSPFGGPAPRAESRETICHQSGDEVREPIDSASVAAASRNDGSSHTIEVMTIRLAHFSRRVLQRSRRWKCAADVIGRCLQRRNARWIK